MAPSDYAQNFLVSALIISVIGLLFGWLMWHVAHRYPSGAQVGTWIGAAIVVTSLVTFQVHRTQTSMGFTPEQQARVPLFWWLLPMWFVAFGAVFLSVRRRIRSGGGPYSAMIAARGLGALWLGIVAYLVAFAVLDFAAIVR